MTKGDLVSEAAKVVGKKVAKEAINPCPGGG